MTERKKIVERCQDQVERALNAQLREIQETISRISTVNTIEEVKALLTEANSIVSFICGEDDELYEQFHYRLFVGETGKVFIIQAEEIDVESFPYGRNNCED